MDAKEQAREILDKVNAWGTAKIGELSFMEQLAIATEPGKKAALLDEERSYAEALISSALSAQAAEVERLNNTLGLREARITELRESRDYWFREYTELERETNELHQPEPTP